MPQELRDYIHTHIGLGHVHRGGMAEHVGPDVTQAGGFGSGFKATLNGGDRLTTPLDHMCRARDLLGLYQRHS